jgi:hypothetical protein
MYHSSVERITAGLLSIPLQGVSLVALQAEAVVRLKVIKTG